MRLFRDVRVWKDVVGRLRKRWFRKFDARGDPCFGQSGCRLPAFGFSFWSARGAVFGVSRNGLLGGASDFLICARATAPGRPWRSCRAICFRKASYLLEHRTG